MDRALQSILDQDALWDSKYRNIMFVLDSLAFECQRDQGFPGIGPFRPWSIWDIGEHVQAARAVLTYSNVFIQHNLISLV